MKKTDFGSARQTFRIAGPVLVENIMASMVSMINTVMVGAIGSGSEAVATVAVNSSPTWVLNSIPMGLCVGSTVLVARNIGAGDRGKANNVANQTVGGILLLAFAISAVMFFFASHHIPTLVKADPAILDDARYYLRVLSLSIVPNFLGLACSGMLRGAGNTKTPMIAGLLTNVLIACLNYILIFDSTSFGFLPIPRAGLGVRGAAISTAIAQTLFGLFMLYQVCGKNQKIRVDLTKAFKLKWDTIRAIFKIGIPAMGERLTISMGQVMYYSTVNSLGTDASSAHHIAVQIESIAYQPANAISTASTTLVGQCLGAKDKKGAQGFANTTLVFALGIGILCFATLFFLPNTLMSLFIDEPSVIAMGASALRIIAPVEPFFCLLIAITGILRGGGDTGFALIAGLAGMWGIRIGSAYIAVNFLGMGLPGAWIGMGADILTRFIIMLVRYRRKKWLNTEEM